MAGNYPDSPSRRFAYDIDGTVVVHRKYAPSAAALVDATALEKAKLNAENDSGEVFTAWWDGSSYHLAFIFPEARELDGVFSSRVNQNYNYIDGFDSSGDSTNGVDGTWTTRIAQLQNNLDVYSLFRDEIEAIAVATETACRLGFRLTSSSTGSFTGIHLYGTISPGETPDRMIFLDTLNADAQFTKPIDYGEVPRGQTQQRTIKIKNNSATKTINTLQLTTEDLYLNAAGWYTYSLDDVTYSGTLSTIGNMGPGATKLIYVKQSLPDDETLGLQTARMHLSHDSLT